MITVIEVGIMSIERNVVILGKVGSGKKTLGNRIVDADKFPCESQTLGTRNVATNYIVHETENAVYRILTVDTESLQTPYNDPKRHILDKHNEVIHLILFVIPKGIYTDESHQSYVHVVKNLGDQAKRVSALVVTHCEGMTDQQRQVVLDRFQNDRRCLKLVDFMGKGLHAVGFPDISTSPPDAKGILQNAIDTDEEAIRKLVEQCDDPLNAEDLYASRDSTGAESSSAAQPHQPSPTSKATDVDFKENERIVILLGKIELGITLIHSLWGRKATIKHTEAVVHVKIEEDDMIYHVLAGADTERLKTTYKHCKTANLIIFIIEGSKDHDALHTLDQALTNNLAAPATRISALVILHDPKKAGEDIIEKFRYRRSRNIAGFMGKGLYAVNTASVRVETSEEAIPEDVEQIRKLFRDCDTPYGLDRLIDGEQSPAPCTIF